MSSPRLATTATPIPISCSRRLTLGLGDQQTRPPPTGRGQGSLQAVQRAAANHRVSWRGGLLVRYIWVAAAAAAAPGCGCIVECGAVAALGGIAVVLAHVHVRRMHSTVVRVAARERFPEPFFPFFSFLFPVLCPCPALSLIALGRPAAKASPPPTRSPACPPAQRGIARSHTSRCARAPYDRGGRGETHHSERPHTLHIHVDTIPYILPQLYTHGPARPTH